MKQCSANITYGQDCDRFLGIFSGKGTGDTVTTQPLETVPEVAEYCFLVTAETNNVTVLVSGTLLSITDSQANVTAIVVSLVFVLLVINLLMVLMVVLAVKHFTVAKLTVHVAFSVEDKPGSLAAALKVFKDCNANILVLNTHVHHAEFNQNAGKGYKFNRVHCKCTEDQKKFLKNELKAEFEGEQVTDSEAVHVDTAIIKVKNSTAALWKAMHTIGNHGIDIVGINTLTKHESIPGHKDNHVQCRCTEKSLHMIRTQLKMLTGRDVYIMYLDDEDKRKERAIEYLVKDEVGALASTLDVISGMGISISDVNPDHLPEYVRAGQTAKHGLKINFIECSMNKSTKKRLFDKLKTQYGAIGVDDHNAPPDKVDEDPDYTIVKVTIHNEIGSLNRILKAFQDLKINIHGINILQPALPLEMEISYKEYHLEITATKEQEANLKKRLLAEGLAIYFTESAGVISRPHASLNAGTESNAESKLDITPTAKIIQFVVKDEVGTLGKTLQIFNELGINITRINRAHLAREHQDEFVVCSCPEDQRESLISKLKSYGATNAEEVKLVDANDCVVKFSVVREVGSTVKVLKAFSDMGVEILKVNPSNVKVHNQYVECCCTEDEQKEILRRLEEVVGVIDVALIAEPESLVSVKPTEDPNYCIIKYSVDEKAGTIVRALTVFFNLKINIIGVNTLDPAFDRTFPVKYKHHHVVLIATDDEVKELKRELLVTRLALDIRPYNRIKHSDNSEALQPGNVDGNDIALTSRV